jgi:hypothetical protein
MKQTKRQQAALARKQEEQAVAMYLAGSTLKAIKRRTTVDGFIVKGLVIAHTLRAAR